MSVQLAAEVLRGDQARQCPRLRLLNLVMALAKFRFDKLQAKTFIKRFFGGKSSAL